MKINTFLKIGTVSSLVLIFFVALGGWLYQNYLNNVHKRYYPFNLRNLQSLAEKLKTKLTVISEPILFNNNGHQISVKPADIKYLNFYLPKFIFEFSKYPPEVISTLGLKEVVIGSDVQLDQRGRPGLHDYHLNMLFFDCRWVNSDRWTRQIIHHELFHLIDWKDGVIYKDLEWEKLNPPEFEYGSGGITLQKPSDWTAGLPDLGLKGFLNRYSMSGLEEDKAEIFANMMANYNEVNLRAKTDPIIKAKVSQMKKLLYSFCPEFNEVFWSKMTGKTTSESKRSSNHIFPAKIISCRNDLSRWRCWCVNWQQRFKEREVLAGNS